MKGDRSDAAQRRRAAINSQIEKIRAGIESLREQIKQAESQYETKNKALREEIDALQERIDSTTGGSGMLHAVVQKERLNMRIKFAREVLAVLPDGEAKQAKQAQLSEMESEAKKVDQAVSDHMDRVQKDHGDDPDVKKASEESAAEAEKRNKLADDRAKYVEALANAKTDAERSKLEQKIADVDKALGIDSEEPEPEPEPEPGESEGERKRREEEESRKEEEERRRKEEEERKRKEKEKKRKALQDEIDDLQDELDSFGKDPKPRDKKSQTNLEILKNAIATKRKKLEEL